jgi:hypothetical protein
VRNGRKLGVRFTSGEGKNAWMLSIPEKFQRRPLIPHFIEISYLVAN